VEAVETIAIAISMATITAEFFFLPDRGAAGYGIACIVSGGEQIYHRVREGRFGS